MGLMHNVCHDKTYQIWPICNCNLTRFLQCLFIRTRKQHPSPPWSFFLQGICFFVNIEQDVYTRRNSNPLRSKRTNREYNEKVVIYFLQNFQRLLHVVSFNVLKDKARWFVNNKSLLNFLEWIKSPHYW